MLTHRQAYSPPLDHSSHNFEVRTHLCWDCQKPIAGNLGVQVSRRLGDSNIHLHAVVHRSCHNQHEKIA